MCAQPDETAVAEAPVEEAAAEQPEEFAIVEIFGHRRHVGRVLEVEKFGTKMLRVDVPTDGDFAKGYVSHLYSGGAIFGMTPTDLDTVVRSNKPSSGYGTYQLPPPDDEDDDNDPIDVDDDPDGVDDEVERGDDTLADAAAETA
jgi:hypothetical protein